MPIVCNIGDIECLFYDVIYYSDHHTVETEDEKGADGDEGDDSAFDVVERFCQVYEGVYRYEIYHII